MTYTGDELSQLIDLMPESEKRKVRARNMAKRKATEDEIDDLVDDLDELDEDEEEVEVDDEDEDDDEVEDDPDEAPKAKRSRKKSSSKKAAATKSGVGTAELADEAGVEARQVRAFLRSSGYQPRDEREGRYNWASRKDPEFREIVKKIKGGAVERMNKQKLADLKEKKSKKSTAKSTKKKSRAKK